MRYPAWKYILIVLVLIVSTVYSLPNLYPDEPAIQISGANAGIKADQAVLSQAETALKQAGLAYHGGEIQEKGVLVRVKTNDEQLKAQEIVKRALGDAYVVALNLAPTTPEWLLNLGARPMKLGLDLRGGVHFLLEVDMSKILEQRQETYTAEIKSKLRDSKIAYRSVSDISNGLTVKFETDSEREKAKEVLAAEYREFVYVPSEKEGAFFLDLGFSPAKLKEFSDYAIEQNLTTLRNRVNELGVAESVVQRQGASRIVVQLPGVQDTAEAKRVLGRTATLEFRFVDWENKDAPLDGIAPAGTEILPFQEVGGQPVLLQKKKIVTGDRVVNAQSGFDEYSNPQVNISLDSRGGKMMADATRDNVGKLMAVVFVEHKQRSRFITDANGQTIEQREPYIEKTVINRATIQSMLGSSFRITGLDSPAEAKELALLLRAGALAAPMYFVEERTIGPSLGQDNIDKGLLSTQVGFAAVALFMLAFYRLFGLIANIALFMNVAMMIAVMSAIGAALSLPGIAGIVLTVGMAVDANVLIFERIREELRAGQSSHSAIIAGYDRAYTTILDANLTTLIVAFILFAVGTGPVKGFAVTLSIGIICSMFTAITVTRAVVQLMYGQRRGAKLSI
ncbi:protein translocase subunit SecD [Agitococcus lubricus]|uniref:Protein translocase subunit SecD n=1 Tax=Agitococcus lubricus TaxID=1077255 RepID=A0A2T5J101_9GAMM|nr:protein translocase subunit SecD [Agitococcus lubricus]PTQ90067.1 preprotein translocase subunit SecD [Agitococcus lubricus]